MKRYLSLLARRIALPAPNLALLRVMTGSYSLVFLLSQLIGYEQVGSTGQIGQFLPLILGLAVVMNLAFVLGWAFVVSGPALAGLLWVSLLLGGPESLNFEAGLVVALHVAILGFSRAADALSVDQLVRRWERKKRNSNPLTETRRANTRRWKYGLPVRILCFATVASFVTFPAQCLQRFSLFMSDGSGIWIWVACFVGASMVATTAPFALFHRRSARGWVVGTVVFCWAFFGLTGGQIAYQLSGIAFLSFWAAGLLTEDVPFAAARRRTAAQRAPYELKSAGA